MRSSFEATGLVPCWAAMLGLVRAVVLAKVIHMSLECGISETSFSLVSMPSPHFQGAGVGMYHLRVGKPHFLGSMGCPLCPFLETLSAPPACSGHSGSGKTEAARKIVQFLSSLEQEQTRDQRCHVRSSGPFSRDPRGTILLLWARRMVSGPLASS